MAPSPSTSRAASTTASGSGSRATGVPVGISCSVGVHPGQDDAVLASTRRSENETECVTLDQRYGESREETGVSTACKLDSMLPSVTTA